MSGRVFNPAERAEAAERGEIEPPPFPSECLPPILRRMAEAVAELQRVPVAMTAPMVLATASAALGRGVRLKVLRGREAPSNLFVCVCKESGTGGSSAFRMVTAPLDGMQARILRQFRAEVLPRLEAEKVTLLLEVEGAKSRYKKAETDADRQQAREDLKRCSAKLKSVEDEIIPPLLYASDSTPESLAEQLAANDDTLAQFNPDAGDSFSSMLGCYRDKSSRDGSHALWLKAFSNEGHTVTRTRRGTVHLRAPCLTMLLVVTPHTARRHLEDKSLLETGFLGRLLLCDPRAVMSEGSFEEALSRPSLPSDASQPYEAAIWKALACYHRPRGLENDDWFPDDDDEVPASPEPAADGEREACMIESAEDALRVLWEDSKRQVDAWQAAEQDREMVARETEMASRLALVCHMFEHMKCSASGQGGTWKVTKCEGHLKTMSGATMRNAVRMRDWFKSSLAAMMASTKADRRDDLYSKVESLFVRSRMECLTPRDIIERGMAKTADAAKKLLDSFVAEGRLHRRAREAKGTGRPPGDAYYLPSLEKAKRNARHLT